MDQEEQTQPRAFPAVSFDEFPPTSYESWKEDAIRLLKGAPFEKKLFTRTHEGIVLDPIYLAANVVDLTHPGTFPGMTDYLRGTEAAGYISEPWTIAQSCDDPFPDQANEGIRKELSTGADAVHFTLDDATLECRDITRADAPADNGQGLSLFTVQDVEEALRGVDTEQYEAHVFAGASAAPLLGLFAAGKGNSDAKIRGCVGADPIGVLAEKGSLPCPLDELYDEMALTVQWAEKNMPGLRTILVRGDVYHNGGANAVQELACAMCTGIAYIHEMQRRGLDIDTVAGQIRFSFSVGANFFMEIAKLRAARMFWAQVVEAFGGNESSRKIDLFANTSLFTQTVYDPYVNVLRATTQAFSGVVGGVSGMNVRRFDESIRPATPLSRRISRNIQLLLQNEFNLQQPVDPAGGSWYVESLTQQLFELAWEMMQRLDAEGGMVEVLRSGLVQGEIDEVLQGRFTRLEKRADRAVGTNMYANVIEEPLEVPASDPAKSREARRAAITEFRATTDEAVRKENLDKLLDKIGGEPGEFMETLIEAFRAGATLAEVRKVLNDDFKGAETVQAIEAHRWTERFEALRKRTEDSVAKDGKNVRVFLANMGPLKQHKPRADFSTAFMEIAHFDILKNDGFETPEEAAKAALESGADVTIICSTDAVYPEFVPPIARAIKAERPDMKVLLAGAPAKEHKDSYIEAGVDDFIHVKANCFRILEALQQARGIC